MTFASYSHPEDRPAGVPAVPPPAPLLRANVHLVVGTSATACQRAATMISARQSRDVIVTRKFEPVHVKHDGKVLVLCERIMPVAGRGYVLYYHGGHSGIVLSSHVAVITNLDKGDGR